MEYTQAGSLQVIDLSYANGSVDWAKVEADAAILRLGYRGYGTGRLVTDRQWQNNLAGAESRGLPYGGYWFSQAISEAEAEEEAAYCIALLEGHAPQFPIYLDSEYANGGKGRGDSLSRQDRTAYARIWCAAMQAAGYKAGVYASEDWWNTHLDVQALADYSIWCAKISSKSPSIGADYDGWQYTFTGTDPGVTGDVDKSYFFTDFREDDEMNYEDWKSFMEQYRSELQAEAGSSWSAEARDWAVAAGLFQGSDNGYMWKDFLTREQAAALLQRMDTLEKT